MSFLFRKTPAHTNPQTKTTPVNVNVTATRREPPVSALLAYRQQLRRWVELADKQHTEAELDAIRADQARRIKAMGGR